jgi:hypothetical protein
VRLDWHRTPSSACKHTASDVALGLGNSHSPNFPKGDGMSDTLIELDERGRGSLGAKLTQGRRRYLGTVDDEGVIVLTPVVVLTETELALHGRPDLQQLIDESYEHPERRTRRGGRPARRPVNEEL